MNRIAALLSVLMLAPAIASAGSTIGASELSVLGGVSMVAGPLLVLASPVLLVSNVLEASANAGKIKVEVTTDKGAKETIELPRAVVEKANLKAGDKLSVKPARSGALLSKNGTPLAYMVTPENAKLSRSHALAR
jgi:hypothetical protein